MPIGECNCCGSRGLETQPFPVPKLAQVANPPELMLCTVCAGSLVGTWYTYRDIHDDTKVGLGRVIAWGINHLKAELAAKSGLVTIWAEPDGVWKVADGYSTWVLGGLLPAGREVPHVLDVAGLGEVVVLCSRNGHFVAVRPAPT